jgi:UDP-2-acetamido-3-amino-2,3-dideoxy-glucuronate N-acetyltransferase
LALTVHQGEELVTLAKDSKKILMVGHILQYHPAIRTLKEMIKNGEFGRIQYIYSNRLNIGKLRTEENILWSFAPHDISVILSLVGEEPTKITAVGGRYLNEAIYDVTLSSLEFKNNIKTHIFVSWLHPFKEQKLVVVGSQGMVVFDDLTKEKLFIYPHQIKWEEGKIPVAQKAECRVVPVEDKEPLREELMHFVECVHNRARPRTDGEEGLAVLKVLDGIEKALRA